MNVMRWQFWFQKNVISPNDCHHSLVNLLQLATNAKIIPLGWLTLKTEVRLPLIFFSFLRLSPIRLQLPKNGNGCVIKVCKLRGHYHSLLGGCLRCCLSAFVNIITDPRANTFSFILHQGDTEAPKTVPGACMISHGDMPLITTI